MTTFQILEELERLSECDAVGNVDVVLLGTQSDDGNDTDCDSGDEDCNDPDRLSHRQLQAPAELIINEDPDFICEVGENSSTNTDSADVINYNGNKKRKRDVASSTKGTKQRLLSKGRVKCPNKSNDNAIEWTDGGLVTHNDEWINPLPRTVSTLNNNSEPIDFFKIFFDEQLVEEIVRETVQYAGRKNFLFNPPLSVDEMYCFFGILILSGYIPLPRRRMFWEQAEDSHNELVSNSMRRNRFEDIFRFLHIVDNGNLDKNDKMAKVRPLSRMLNDKFILHAPIEKDLSIDESMIPYFGRNGCKQHIKGKPIRFGYKVWVVATKLGYALSTDLYQGKVENDSMVGSLGERVVKRLVSKVKEEYNNTNFSVYCDNFFTSPNLLVEMKKMNVFVTGTVRENRTKQCPLKAVKLMQKEKRGTYDSKVSERYGITAIRWKDNNVVTVMSNEYGLEPMKSAKRYSAQEKKKVLIPQPDAVHQYNRYMGGVDQLDGNVSAYRIAIRGKKWYMPIILWYIDVCVNNAYQLLRVHNKSYDMLGFRRNLSTTLLRKYGTPRILPGPSKSVVRVVANAVKENNGHFVIPNQQRRRCAYCKNKTTKICKKCNVPLHDKCFETFHL